jgi:hypothetical protein
MCLTKYTSNLARTIMDVSVIIKDNKKEEEKRKARYIALKENQK